MGSACCVAARDHTLPSRTRSDTLHRNIRHSPSWSFRWDNRVSGELGNDAVQCSQGNIGNAGSLIKDGISIEREEVADVESPLDNLRRPSWQKPAIHDGAIGNSTTPASDLSVGSSLSTEVKDSIELSPIAEPSTSSTPSRHPRRSPGHQLLRGISDTRILGLKSPTTTSTSSSRQSFLLSNRSSDGWSMRTFSELVASSQRDRWSFDTDLLTTPKPNRHSSTTCAVCSKLLTDRPSYLHHKIPTNEVSVVAVLVCGHVYHSECLENVTVETEKYDPSCPVCCGGEKQGLNLKMCGKQDSKIKSGWISRNRIVDSDVEGNSNTGILNRRKVGKMKNSFVKPFLKRHFSLGSKPNEMSIRRKGGFWARYH